MTTGPDGRARRLVECFGDLGLLRPAADTIDAVVRAVAGALVSVAAIGSLRTRLFGAQRDGSGWVS